MSIDYAGVAASAGVIWSDTNKYVHGHMARVMMVNGDGFFHPCTCPIGAEHDAFEPQMNPGSPEVPQYVPLSADLVIPDPTNADVGVDPDPDDPNVSNHVDPNPAHGNDNHHGHGGENPHPTPNVHPVDDPAPIPDPEPDPAPVDPTDPTDPTTEGA